MITHIFSNLDGMLLDEEGKVTPKQKSGILLVWFQQEHRMIWRK